jgi:hypothetical protein
MRIPLKQQEANKKGDNDDRHLSAKKARGSASTASRALLILTAIVLFARMYYIINENKIYQQTLFLSREGRALKRTNQMAKIEIEETPLLFAMFLLVLAGMPILG